MITLGSVTREDAERRFHFLQGQMRGRRKAINAFTHADPDFVFWIYPEGRLFDAKDAHIRNPPPGFRWILDDEPDYGGFLRGRVATSVNGQLVVVYCRSEALAHDAVKMGQFLDGMSQLPFPLSEDALVVSDNGDIYGTMGDVEGRMGEVREGSGEA
jgi:hypothetical protein